MRLGHNLFRETNMTGHMLMTDLPYTDGSSSLLVIPYIKNGTPYFSAPISPIILYTSRKNRRYHYILAFAVFGK